jgi:hypothetical protein
MALILKGFFSLIGAIVKGIWPDFIVQTLRWIQELLTAPSQQAMPCGPVFLRLP